MIIFIDYKKKIVFICPPKCGNNSIAKYLNIPLHNEYSNDDILSVLNDDNYIKLFVIRKNIIERFLSGFYEDLFNNACYDNLEITFKDYLKFLFLCFKNKINNVKNIEINGNILPIYYGNCSNLELSITDENGNFQSHIQTQKYTLQHYVNFYNIKLIEINDLNILFGKNINLNKKEKINEKINISNIKLKLLKKNLIIINSDCLTDSEKEIILEIYNEDITFIKELESTFKYYNI